MYFVNDRRPTMILHRTIHRLSCDNFVIKNLLLLLRVSIFGLFCLCNNTNNNNIFVVASATCHSRDVDTNDDTDDTTSTTNHQQQCQNNHQATTTITTTNTNNQLPHILFIILDDLGSNDLGFHNSGIHTPIVDQLATVDGGIYLSNYYVLPYCSPTRAALVSGRYPLHTGLHTIITEDSTDGLPLDEVTLPTVLRQVGYSAHAVGKWHIGHSKWEQTPTYRGFESFYGYYLGRSDYYSHYKDSEIYGVDGYDLRYDSTEFCGPHCSTLVDERGNYSTHIFTREAIRIIHEHKAKKNDEVEQKPLFLYLAHQAVHSPNEVPSEYSDLYTNRTDWTDLRKLYAGMLTAADESIGNVTRALQEAGLWNNTLVVFTTDNGGPTGACSIQGSSNGIRRGGKCTVWDGGTLGDAFLSGPALQKILQRQQQQQQQPPDTDDQASNKVNGIRYPYLFHAVDWLPTLAEIVGATPNGKPLDGVSHLQALQSLVNFDDTNDAATVIPPREELFVGYASIKNKWYGPAVRYKNWKLIQGISGGPQTATDNPDGPIDPAPGGIMNSTYLLFDIDTDPEESNDISAEYPIIVQILQAKLREYQSSYVPPISHDSTCDPFTGLINTSQFGPAWMPWWSKVIVYS